MFATMTDGIGWWITQSAQLIFDRTQTKFWQFTKLHICTMFPVYRSCMMLHTKYLQHHDNIHVNMKSHNFTRNFWLDPCFDICRNYHPPKKKRKRKKKKRTKKTTKTTTTTTKQQQTKAHKEPFQLFSLKHSQSSGSIVHSVCKTALAWCKNCF